MSRNYEFNEQENDVFSDVVFHARLLGLLVVIAGAFYLFLLGLQAVYVYERSLAVFPLVAAQVLGVLSALLLAAHLVDGSSSLKKVVDTEGKDIEHLLSGLVRFSTLFRDGAIIFWILCGLVGAMILWAGFFGGAS